MDPSRLQERLKSGRLGMRRVHISGLEFGNDLLPGPRWNLRFFS